jgi:phosphate transport system substrate-binding protein
MAIYAVVAVVVVAAVVGAAGYELKWFGGHSSGQAVGSCPSPETLQGSGANFILPLMTSWEQSYTSATGNSVNYNPGGSGAGVTALTNKLVDFAASDAPLNSSARSALTAQTSVLTLPITAGGLAIVYHLSGVSGSLNLSGPVIAEIYTGKITMWNDPAIARNNTAISNLPAHSILTVHRSDPAGTTYVLADYLSQTSPAWATSPGKGLQLAWPKAPAQITGKGNSGVLTDVENNAYSIGYVDLTDVLTATTVPQYASLLNPSGAFVAPTLADVASAIADKSATTSFPAASADWTAVSMVNAPGAGDYPLATFAYLYVYQAVNLGFTTALPNAQALVQFINWAATSGQGAAASLDYVALAPAIVAQVQSALGTMTFDGTAIPACR